jgi:hypothetical protein
VLEQVVESLRVGDNTAPEGAVHGTSLLSMNNLYPWSSIEASSCCTMMMASQQTNTT